MKEEKLTRLKILRVMSYRLLHLLHELYEFEAYFIFTSSTTLTENMWWRYAFKYREEYSCKV